MPAGGQDGGRGPCVVRVGGGAHPAIAGASVSGAVLEEGRESGGVVLDVPAGAEQGERYAAFAQQGLGGLVVLGQAERAGGGVDDARVGDKPGAGLASGLDRVAVLLHPLGSEHAAGDQQQSGRAGEGSAQRSGIGVVGDADVHAGLGEVADPAYLAAGGDDLGGGYAALEQVLDGQAAECSGGTGDDQGHGWLLFRLVTPLNRPRTLTLPFHWYALLA